MANLILSRKANQSTAYRTTELVSAYALFFGVRSRISYPLAVLQATATQEGLTERDTQRPNDLLDVSTTIDIV